MYYRGSARALERSALERQSLVAGRGVNGPRSSQLIEHRLDVRDQELAGLLHVDTTDDAVLHEQGEATRAHAHARDVRIQPELARQLGAAVTQHAHAADGAVLAAPGGHHETVIDGDAPDFVDAPGAQRLEVLNVAGQVLGRARRRVGAGQPEHHDALALGLLGDAELDRPDRARLAELRRLRHRR